VHIFGETPSFVPKNRQCIALDSHYTRTSQKSKFSFFLAYLLYISTSGFHILCGGILRSFTPPYSDEFHRKLTSFHSWEPTSNKSDQNRNKKINKSKKLLLASRSRVEFHTDDLHFHCSALDPRSPVESSDCRKCSTYPITVQQKVTCRPITKIFSIHWQGYDNFCHCLSYDEEYIE
jgi:hypothetical protein